MALRLASSIARTGVVRGIRGIKFDAKERRVLGPDCFDCIPIEVAHAVVPGFDGESHNGVKGASTERFLSIKGASVEWASFEFIEGKLPFRDSEL